MRSLFFLAAVSFSLLVASTNVPGQKVRLRSQITPDCDSSGSALRYADIHADGNIAVQGSYACRGAFIYDISNPDAPVLSSWYNPGNNQQFLEAIVVGNRGYFGSGSGGGGVHIVDLTNPSSPQLLGTVNGTNANAYNFIHEMVVFSQNGATYLVENFNSLNGNKNLKVINVTNPATPVFVRDISPTEPQWVHAMHIRGNRMFTSGWGNSGNRGRTEIYDISNIGTQAPTLLGFVEDPSSTTAGNNMHSSWSSENGNYLYSARETNNGTGDIRVYDITEPAVPLLVRSITMAELGLNAVTPHNPAVFGNRLYVSWYQAGIQVFDISNPANPLRIGQYDTFQPAFAPGDQERKALANAEPWDVVCGSEFRQNPLPTTYDGNWAVFPFLGNDKVLAGDLSAGLMILDASEAATASRNRISDFDGDRKTDLSVYTPATGRWLIENSSNSTQTFYTYGENGDQLINGDFDGDGKSDIGVWRPSNGTWYIQGSSLGYITRQWGANGDVPVPGDYDADGKADLAVWRPSNGLWYIIQSTLGYRIREWGVNGDKAFTGDFEGDGKADLVIWRPSNGTWYIIPSSSSIPVVATWGENGDKPLLADFDGDGRAEYTIYRPSVGTWYILNPANGSIRTQSFGIAEDVPIPADFDGDSRSDIAVFRPSTNVWYRLNSSVGGYVVRGFGQSGDTPAPVAAQPD